MSNKPKITNGPKTKNGNSALVVLQKGAKRKTKKVTQVTNGIRLGYQTTRDNFLLSLVSPFCPEAYGVRVPDPFPFPTVTHHLRQSTVLGVGAGGTGSVVFLPSPILSMIDLNAVLGAAVNVSSTPMTKFGGGTVNQHIYKATSATNLNATYGSYRTVSWGIKISNLQPELSATGRIFIAMVPIGDSVPSEAELNNTNITSPALLPIFGTTLNQLASSALLQLPSGQAFAVQDLLHGDLEVSGMYTNSTFWQFKTTNTQGDPYSIHRSGDSYITNTTTGVIATSGYKDPDRMPGGCAIVIWFEGIPASTVNAIQVETIYHMEGSPQLANAANTIPVPSGAEKVLIGTTDIVDKAMGLASKLENVFTFVTKGADFLNRSSAAMDRMTQAVTVGGYAARAIM